LYPIANDSLAARLEGAARHSLFLPSKSVLTVNFNLEGQLLGDIWFDLSTPEHPKWITTTKDGVKFKSYLSCTAKVRYENPMFGE
jgi:hypothetical protein